MKPFSKFLMCATFSLAALTMGCAEMKGGSTSGAGSSTPSTSNGLTNTENTGPNRVSQGTQGDSLSACLSRIPSDASAGQRMVAEGTCQRDADNRVPIDIVPGQ